jgi:hypothetical protein
VRWELHSIQDSGKNHSPVRDYKALLWADSYKVGWASFQQECSVEDYKNSPSRIRSGLGVIKISPNRIGSGLGVAQSVRLTSSGWEPRGLKWIRHAKSIGRNRHRGGRDIGWNLSARLVVPSSRKRIRPGLRAGTLPILGFI